ncbi:N-acetylmuramoyl-L-alanine amidase [Paenibacillus sp. JTLBN-2024]
MYEATGLKDRGVRYGNFHVVSAKRKCRPFLLEVGYLSIRNDEKPPSFSESFQQRVAQGIADGIQEYLGVQ